MANSTSNKPAPDLAAALRQQWSALMADRCVLEVALSGGLDSVVLLHVLQRLQSELPITVRAVHVHHGLQAAADEWVVFCHYLCAQWQIPRRVEKVAVSRNGQGIEGAARTARYAAFARSEAAALVLAHHQDDQTETFMLAALRGGGLRALAAMPPLRRLDDDKVLWRPLLPFSRAQLQQYAAAWQLPYVEDGSNHDTSLLRNWLRQQGLPPWQARLPHLAAQIGSSIGQLQDALALQDEVCAQDWQQVCAGGVFDVQHWRRLSPQRQQLQLHYFARQHDLGVPSRSSIAAFAAQLRLLEIKQAQWPLPQGAAVLHRHILWPQRADIQQQWPWLAQLPCRVAAGVAPVAVPLYWRVHKQGLPADMTGLSLRCVLPNDVLLLKIGRKNVKKMLQERKVAPFMRNIWPILVDQEQRCVAVPGVAVAVDVGVAGGLLPWVAGLPKIIKT